MAVCESYSEHDQVSSKDIEVRSENKMYLGVGVEFFRYFRVPPQEFRRRCEYLYEIFGTLKSLITNFI